MRGDFAISSAKAMCACASMLLLRSYRWCIDAKHVRYVLYAWRFPVYYTLNAALIMFGGLLLNLSPVSPPGMNLPKEDLVKKIEMELHAIRGFGGNVRLVERCRAYLQKILQITSLLTSQRQSTMPFPSHRTLLPRCPKQHPCSSIPDG